MSNSTHGRGAGGSGGRTLISSRSSSTCFFRPSTMRPARFPSSLAVRSSSFSFFTALCSSLFSSSARFSMPSTVLLFCSASFFMRSHSAVSRSSLAVSVVFSSSACGAGA